MNLPNVTRRTFLAGSAATAGVAALGLAGCGSNSNSGSGSSSTSNAKAAAKTITAAPAYSSTSYSPIGNSSAVMLAATWHVFEGLYDLDLHDYKPYAALAAGEPTKVTDTEYEVTIRSGAKFSDGTAVTADDVVNAFEKNIANDTYGAFLSFIDSVSAKDDTTVTFKLKYAFEALLKGRLSVVKIFPKSQTEDELKKMPIGSGPWKYESINGDDGGTIKFVKNTEYNGSKKAENDEMEWNILLDNTSRTTAVTSGSAVAIENVPDSNADQITNSGMAVEYVPGFALPFLMFNCKKAPFDNPKVRQAFFYAIDVDKLIKNQMAGHANAATSFLPETYANYHKASTVFSYDPEKAKSLLAEAGQTSISCELMVNNNWVKNLAAQIQSDLSAVGIEVTINETKIDWASLAPSENILPYDVMLTPGDPSCFGNDPDLLMTWWYGDNVWTQGRSCWKGTAEHTELLGLLQQAREAKSSEQQDIWNKCFDLIAENCPIYPLFHRETGTAYDSSKLEGFSGIGTTGLVFLGAKATE